MSDSPKQLLESALYLMSDTRTNADKRDYPCTRVGLGQGRREPVENVSFAVLILK